MLSLTTDMQFSDANTVGPDHRVGKRSVPTIFVPPFLVGTARRAPLSTLRF
jgi:hypothetical protein